MNNTGRCSIQIGGEQIELLFGMPAVEYVFKKVEEGSMLIDDTGSVIGHSSFAFLIHAGYWNFCIANSLTPKKKIGDFFSLIEEIIDDDNFQREMVAVAETYRDSRSLNKMTAIAEKQAEELKKKTAELIGKISSPSVMANSDSPESSIAS